MSIVSLQLEVNVAFFIAQLDREPQSKSDKDCYANPTAPAASKLKTIKGACRQAETRKLPSPHVASRITYGGSSKIRGTCLNHCI